MFRTWLRGVRFFVVTVCVVGLTSLSIDATDYFTGSSSALGVVADHFFGEQCPADMVLVTTAFSQRYCIDKYEASVGTDCAISEPYSVIETAGNINDPDCEPVSAAGKKPWVHVLRVQADQLCARAGKRLPGADEWYFAARGTPDDSQVCTLMGSLVKSGEAVDCRSGAGAYDMVGNVWEWVADTAEYGRIANHDLPGEGYVAGVSGVGLPTATATDPQVLYNNDYTWSVSDEVRYVMRGGYYGSGTDGGMYAVHAATAEQFSSDTVGFRCVLSLSS